MGEGRAFAAGEAVRAATQSAVAAAQQELGYEEPRPALERSMEAAGQSVSHADTDSDDGDLTAEELSGIDSDPRSKAVYRSLVRKARAAGERLDAEGQQVGFYMRAVEDFRRDPDGVLRALAQARGGRIELPGDKTPRERIQERLAKSIGPEAAEVLAEPIIGLVQEMTEPLIGDLQERERQSGLQQLREGIAEFGHQVKEAGGEWSLDVEHEMAALVPKFPPGPSVRSLADLPGYLEILHAQVMAERRLMATIPAPATPATATIRAGMNPREAARIAVAAAQREVRAR